MGAPSTGPGGMVSAAWLLVAPGWPSDGMALAEKAPAAVLERDPAAPTPLLGGEAKRDIVHVLFVLKCVITEVLLTSLIGPASMSIVRAFRDWICWTQKFQGVFLSKAASVVSSTPMKSQVVLN